MITYWINILDIMNEVEGFMKTHCIFLPKYLFIRNEEWERERKSQRDLPSNASVLKCLQHLGLDQAEAGNMQRHLGLLQWVTGIQIFSFCLSRCVMEIGSEQESLVSNEAYNTGHKFSNPWLSTLYHNTWPAFFIF